MKPEGPVTRRGDLTFSEVEHAVGAAFVRRHHYARGCSKSGKFFGAYRGAVLVGVCQYLPPTKVAAQSVSERWRQVLSLTRMAVLDSEPTNSTSMLLAASMRWVKTLRLPDGSRWEWLVTYADEAQGHTGAIYRATNWKYVGRTGPYPRWEDSERRQVATKAGPRTRTAEQMRALGYINTGSFYKEKFVFALDTSNRNEHNAATGNQGGSEVRYIGNIIKALTTHSGRSRSNSPAIKPDVKVESEMNFGELLANAKGTQRGARINDNSVNEMTIAGIGLKKTRKGKLAFIVDYVVDKSAGKSAGNHADDARTPYPAGNAHIEGTQVSEYIDLTEDWGPGIAKELLLAALGASEKDVTPEQASLLFEKVPRSDKELAPSGANVARGLKLRVDMVSYTTKQGRSRFVANYSQVPQTPDQLAENIARLDKMGVK